MKWGSKFMLDPRKSSELCFFFAQKNDIINLLICDNKAFSVCWWRSCSVIESSRTATKWILWSDCFLHWNRSCSDPSKDLQPSAVSPAWSLCPPWRSGTRRWWRRGRRPLWSWSPGWEPGHRGRSPPPLASGPRRSYELARVDTLMAQRRRWDNI